MTTMPNYKKNFTLNSSLKIEKEKKLLANIGLIIKKIRIQRGITRDILAIKSKRRTTRIANDIHLKVYNLHLILKNYRLGRYQ